MPYYEHPRQIFALDYPEGWAPHYQEDTGSVTFIHSGIRDATALSLSPILTAEETLPTGEALVARLVETAHRLGMPLEPQAVRLEERGNLLLAYGEGESSRPDFNAVQGHMRLWLLHAGRIALYATQLGPGAQVPEQREVVDAAMLSLRVPELAPPAPNDFQERVMEVVRREYPRFQPVQQDEWTLELVDTEGDLTTTLGLENLYRSCLLNSEAAGVLIRDYLDQLIASVTEQDEYTDFAAVRERLLPVLKPEEWVREVSGNHPLAHVTFAPGLLLCFAVDSPSRLTYVSTELLEQWGVPLERVQELATDNLARNSTELPLTILPGRDDRPIAIAVNTQDGYDASRLALPGLRETFAEELGEDYLVGVPNRDFLIAFSQRDPEIAENIVRQVKQDFQRMNHPLTTTIYRVHADMIEQTDL